jgi:hypothetical protein
MVAMRYEPQPGTIPHRAVAWLRAMAKCRPGYEPSSVEICAGLDIDPDGFVAYMRYVREHGVVHTRKAPVGRLLYWRLGDGTQDPTLGWRRTPATVAFDAQVELTAKIWMFLLKAGGRWLSGDVAAGIREDSARVGWVLAAMVRNDNARRFEVQNMKRRFTYGVTGACKVPRLVSVQQVAECVMTQEAEAEAA